MTFVLGNASQAKLAKVDPRLRQLAERAISLSTQDFTIETGWRSDADQMYAWRHGASQKNGIPIGQTVNGVKGTGRGNHQDGHAIDATPWVNGKILWAAVPAAQQWDYIYPVAEAFRQAAIQLKLHIRWGGVWDTPLELINGGLKAAVFAYEARHKGPDLIDGPHFEVYS